MNWKLSRRHLLRTAWSGGAAAVGGLPLLDRLARANGPEHPELYYVFAYFSGGWDVLVSLDPRDPATFTSEIVPSTFIEPAYDQLQNSDGQLVRTANHTFGPFIGELARHSDKLAVLNGMSMETLTHEAGRRRFLTGKAPSGLQARGSSASSWLTAHHGNEQPIPNLAIRVESYNVDQPTFATALKANAVPDLLRALRPSDPGMPTRLAEQLDQLMSQTAACPVQRESAAWQSAEGSRTKARAMAFGGLDALFDFQARTPEMEAVRAHYGIPGGNAGLRSPEAQAAMAAQAIKGGVSRCVSIQATSGLDTHYQEWAIDQGPRQQQGFDAVARLIDDLATSPYRGTGESWLDHTVIVGFSEFSRTALLNQRGGRDHSLTNSCFILGPGIRPGTYGASSDVGMAPLAVDLETGRPDPGGETIRPEHVIRTLMANAGIAGDPADLRVSPYSALQRSLTI